MCSKPADYSHWMRYHDTREITQTICRFERRMTFRKLAHAFQLKVWICRFVRWPFSYPVVNIWQPINIWILHGIDCIGAHFICDLLIAQTHRKKLFKFHRTQNRCSSMWHVSIESIWSFAWNVPSLCKPYHKKDWFHSVASCTNVTQQTAYQRTTNRTKNAKKYFHSLLVVALDSCHAEQTFHRWFACFAIERDAICSLPFVSTANGWRAFCAFMKLI